MFEADPLLQDYVQYRLVRANRLGRYKHERGALSEEICPCILSLGDWEEVQSHPQVARINAANSHLPGPDSLMRYKVSDASYLAEFKWWKKMELGFKDAYRDLTRGYGKIWARRIDMSAGAIVGLLDWDPESPRGRLHTAKVSLGATRRNSQ